MKKMLSDRRKMGRPKNPNLAPANARLATTQEALNKLDRMITYSRMPLGRKLETALNELEYYRKNRLGQIVSTTNGLQQQMLIPDNTNNGFNVNVNSDTLTDWNDDDLNNFISTVKPEPKRNLEQESEYDSDETKDDIPVEQDDDFEQDEEFPEEDEGIIQE